ncbi:hypothetical protein VUR80DRAFT_9803 [Thermomyces stellatus]
MLCRIAWCARFVAGYFAERGLGFDALGLLPGGAAVGVCVAGRYVLEKGVEVWGGRGPFTDVLVMGVLAVPVVALLGFAERRFLMECYSSLRSK